MTDETLLTRKTFYEHGFDCRHFECAWGKDTCKPGTGGTHGVGSLTIRWIVTGPKGAVQFALNTGWLPLKVETTQLGIQIPRDYGERAPYPSDLGYHAREPQYEGQDSMGPCQHLDGAECYYDGSTLNAGAAFYTLVNGGGDALWTFMEQLYRSTFEDGQYPEPVDYPFPRR